MSAQQPVSTTYSIREASKLTGLPSSTLRYYESIGIVKQVERGRTSGHRTYTQADIDILDTIACLNATGMKLDAMRVYIANLTGATTNADDQISLLQAQQDRLKEEERQITLRKEYVKLKIEYWKAYKNASEERKADIAGKAKALVKELKKL